MDNVQYDVIIIGGSIAGLSAGMALGRSLRKTLIIDSGTPCNLYTPKSHNFITQDGKMPSEITALARAEVLKYKHVEIEKDLVTDAEAADSGFKVTTCGGKTFYGSKILIATGLYDEKPEIPGFVDCWGSSILHCPYCHGYEVKNEPTAIFANGEAAYHLGVLINNWTEHITVLTNGTSELRNEEFEKLRDLNIDLIEDEIAEFVHHNGQLKEVRFKNGENPIAFKAAYASIPFRQQSDIAQKLGCKISSHGHIDVDDQFRTTVPGVYAAGDCVAQPRALSVAAASGTRVGFTINIELILKKEPVNS